MKITMAQLNPTVGDLTGNLEKVGRTLVTCAGDSPDLVVFSELFLTGYPPRDLLERTWFIEQAEAAVAQLCALSRDYPETGIVIGVPLPNAETVGKGLHNAALLIQAGRVLFRQNKTLLPTYDVFDEARYFDPAPQIAVFPFRDEMLGISTCEDAWNDPEMSLPHYAVDPIARLADQGATVMVNISASPFGAGKEEIRYELLRRHAVKHGTPFISVNQVGANDELIFDGRSLFVDAAGHPASVFPAFVEHTQTIDTHTASDTRDYVPQPIIESIYQALLLGIRDYVRKTGFRQVVLGLSGGIDSALTCALAVAALGRENVLGVSMPSHYSSEGSVPDARQLAQNLGIRLEIIPLAETYNAYLEMLRPAFAGRETDVAGRTPGGDSRPPGIAEENIQARIRGNILMALSNKFGWLVLTTGNKSELAVGYCTLYGDMSGGLAVIADVPKMLVYELARYINRDQEIIPQASIDKPPSAELRPDQTDQDTLPPYDLLDRILKHYVDEGRSLAKIIDLGYDRQTTAWIARAVDRNEYKRWQAAPGLKVTSKAFGMGRRMPVAARYQA